MRIAETGLSTYPDCAVVCGRTARAVDDPLAVINPVLLVEVTSASTEEYDRGEKLRHYQHLPSLQEVLLASHREARISVLRRVDESWTTKHIPGNGSIELRCLTRPLNVAEIYRDGFEDLAIG